MIRISIGPNSEQSNPKDEARLNYPHVPKKANREKITRHKDDRNEASQIAWGTLRV